MDDSRYSPDRTKHPFGELPDNRPTPASTVDDTPQHDEPPQPGPTRRRAPQPTTSREDFTLPCAPLQVKLPQDLIQSLKLHSISMNKTMSEIVLDCLTSNEQIAKAWISTRRAGA